MELIDRYTTAIGKRLPAKNRADIEREIRSILQDMLEDRSQKAGRPVDDALVSEVLKEYGAPDRVAATYLSERSLIGPRLYPIFLTVIKIVATVLSVLALFGLGIALGNNSLGWSDGLRITAQHMQEYIQGLIAALGIVILVFAFLERVLPESDVKSLKDEDQNWDPADLLKEPDTNAVALWELIVEIVAAFAGLVLFNFYPQIIGFTPA